MELRTILSSTSLLADVFKKIIVFMLSFLENYSKICSCYLNRIFVIWILKIFNKGKRSKTAGYFKNTFLRKQGSFQKKR